MMINPERKKNSNEFLNFYFVSRRLEFLSSTDNMLIIKDVEVIKKYSIKKTESKIGTILKMVFYF